MAFYIPLIDKSKRFINMMKTTTASPADGNWSKVGTSPWSGLSDIVAMASVKVGTDIHVIAQVKNDHVHPGGLKYSKFSTSTDSWTIRSEDVAQALSTDASSITFPTLGIQIRSDGDVVVLYHSGTDKNPRFIRREGTTWTIVATSIGVNKPGGVLIGPDSSDRMTGVVTDDSLNDVVTRSLSSANAVGTATNVDTAADTASLIVAPGVMVSDVVKAPFIDASNKASLASFTAAATPSPSVTADITDNTVYGHGRTAAPFAAMCLAKDGTNLHLLYADDTTQDLFHSSDTGSGWGGADAEIMDAATINRVSCNKGTSDLLYVVDDGGVVKFGKVTLGAAPPSQFIPRTIII